MTSYPQPWSLVNQLDLYQARALQALLTDLRRAATDNLVASIPTSPLVVVTLRIDSQTYRQLALMAGLVGYEYGDHPSDRALPQVSELVEALVAAPQMIDEMRDARAREALRELFSTVLEQTRVTPTHRD